MENGLRRERERFLERKETGKRGEAEKQTREGLIEDAMGIILTIFFFFLEILSAEEFVWTRHCVFYESSSSGGTSPPSGEKVTSTVEIIAFFFFFNENIGRSS